MITRHIELGHLETLGDKPKEDARSMSRKGNGHPDTGVMRPRNTEPETQMPRGYVTTELPEERTFFWGKTKQV